MYAQDMHILASPVLTISDPETPVGLFAVSEDSTESWLETGYGSERSHKTIVGGGNDRAHLEAHLGWTHIYFHVGAIT